MKNVSIESARLNILTRFRNVLSDYIRPDDQEYLRETGQKQRIYYQLLGLKFALHACGMTETEVSEITKQAHANFKKSSNT